MKTFAIMQARMTSTRLPEKILKEVLGRPLMLYEIERLRRVPEIDEMIVATTTNATDDPVVSMCEEHGVKWSRGSEDDVLDRYYQCALRHGAAHGDTIVRVTADCPLIDPDVASAVIKTYFAARDRGERIDHLGIDYGTLPHGTDVEVFSFDVLERTWHDGKSQMDREHVTWYMWHTPEKMRHAKYSHDKNYGGYRITVDTPEDFELVRSILEELYQKNSRFTLDDVIEFLDSHKEIKSLNAEIKQKHF